MRTFTALDLNSKTSQICNKFIYFKSSMYGKSSKITLFFLKIYFDAYLGVRIRFSVAGFFYFWPNFSLFLNDLDLM